MWNDYEQRNVVITRVFKQVRRVQRKSVKDATMSTRASATFSGTFFFAI